MDHRALLGLCGLARLPEELVDLVCSFVVRDSEVKDFVTTLGSLCLTSRQFVGPAQRALLYDPSRILARRPERPALGVHIKRLEYLVAIWDGAPALSFYHEDPIAFFNWAVSLVHHCLNLEAVAVWPDAAVGWVEVLQNLPRLCHLVVQSRGTEPELQADLATAPSFLASLRLDHLRSLTLWHIGCFPRCPEPALRLPVAHLILDECDLVNDELAIDFSTVRHLTLKPYDPQSSWCRGRLAPVLESFVFTPGLPLSFYEPHWSNDWWSSFFRPAPALPSLTVVVLESVLVNLGAFEQVASVALHLQHIDLRGSTWDPDDWAASSFVLPADDRLVNVLSPLAHLRFLHLGLLPVCAEGILDTQVFCRLQGIELEWRSPVPVLPSPSPSPSPSLTPWRSLADSPAEHVDAESSSGGDDESAPSWCRASRWQASSDSDDSDDSSSASSASASSPASLSRATFPRISRKPSLVRDSDDLASHWAVLARPPTADQVYLDAPADEARLEHGYQVGDEADEDIEGEAYEPWRAWGEACDVGDADRAWRECSDEGSWECARECWD
ncbi:hypothetical protein JCM3770_006139 [Rhodotorula araucariae]